MTDEAASGADEQKWRCPWCGGVADQPTAHQVTCESRTCSCGAVAFATAPWARALIFYEAVTILYDPVNVFRVDLRLEPLDIPFLREDLVRSGVEIRDGVVAPSFPGTPGAVEYQYVWFRRRAAPGG